MWFVPVEYQGCSVSSVVKVEAVVGIVRGLVGRARWRDEVGVQRVVGAEDVMVIAPYNEQVGALAGALGAVGVARVGTVDRFQGQQAW